MAAPPLPQPPLPQPPLPQPPLPQAVIAFISNNYDTSGNLVGRQSASQGFLRGYLRHGGAETYVGLSNSPAELEGFKAFVATHARPGTGARGLLPTLFGQIAEIGTLYRPGPDLGYYAWLRRGIDQRGFSLVGVNHTLSGADAALAIGGLLTAPVQPWDALVCTSAASRAVVERMLGEYSAYFASLSGAELKPRLQLPVIPLGVDCDAFAPPGGADAARAAERARLGIEADEIVLLYLGRLNHVEKANPLPMYMAAEQAAASGKKIRLIEAGWFPSPDFEQIFAQGTAILAPSVRRMVLDGTSPDNRRVWFAADIFVSLSDNIQESFGLTPIEAMAAGLPVVVSDWDGYRDTVRDGVDGFRIPTLMPPPGTGEAMAFLFAANVGGEDVFCGSAGQSIAVDPGAAAAMLLRLIEDEPLRRRMGAAAQARARECYDWPVVIAAYQRLWGELAELRRSAPVSAELAPGRAARPLAMDPYELFRAFPATTIGADTIFTLTPGITVAMAQGMTRLPLATPLRSFLLPDAGLAVIVARLGAGPARAGELLALFAPEQRNPVWLTLGWMAKTGLAGWA